MLVFFLVKLVSDVVWAVAGLAWLLASTVLRLALRHWRWTMAAGTTVAAFVAAADVTIRLGIATLCCYGIAGLWSSIHHGRVGWWRRRHGLRLMDHADLADYRTKLYRFWAARKVWWWPRPVRGELLYVGISIDALIRLTQHDESGKVPDDGILRWITFPDRASALAAEREAIRRERPRLNVAHNGNNPRRRRLVAG